MLDELYRPWDRVYGADVERIPRPTGIGSTSVDDLIALMDRDGVDVAVVMPSDHSRVSTRVGHMIPPTSNDFIAEQVRDAGVFGTPALMRRLFTPATTPGGAALPYAYGWYVQEHRGETLYWHSGWDEEAVFSALYLKVPERDLTLILLANGEGLWWGNPLDRAAVEGSPFARVFLDRFVFGKVDGPE